MITKSLLLTLAVFALVGCDSRYRYPCQDPDNWDKQICKKPWCSADGSCPEDLTHYEKPGAPKPVPPTPNKSAQGGAGKC